LVGYTENGERRREIGKNNFEIRTEAQPSSAKLISKFKKGMKSSYIQPDIGEL